MASIWANMNRDSIILLHLLILEPMDLNYIRKYWANRQSMHNNLTTIFQIAVLTMRPNSRFGYFLRKKDVIRIDIRCKSMKTHSWLQRKLKDYLELGFLSRARHARRIFETRTFLQARAKLFKRVRFCTRAKCIEEKYWLAYRFFI